MTLDAQAISVADHTRALIARDGELPALTVVLDPDRLGDVVRHAEPALASGPVQLRRLRYKPATSVLASVSVGTGGDARWLLVAGYGRATADKLSKDVEQASCRRHPALAVDAGQRWVVLPAAGDRWFPSSGGERFVALGAHQHVATLSYNPRRRLVAAGTHGDGSGWVAKLYGRGAARVPRQFLRTLRRSGVPLARQLRAPHRSIALARRVDGRQAEPGADGAVVAEALRRLATTAVDAAAVPRWGVAELARQLDMAGRFVAAVLPERAASLHRTCAVIGGRAAELERLPAVLLHGDLSPDQVVVTRGGAVLVDLDACAVGPSGWDQSTWLAAQVATGRTVRPLPGAAPSPLLLAAAHVVRAPEPFRHGRGDWAARTTELLDQAAACLGLAAER